MRAGKRLPILLSIVLFGTSGGAIAAAAAAAPASPHREVTLQVCRMAGIGSEAPGAITIPSGTRFDDKDTTLLAQPELGNSGPANVSNPAPVILVTNVAVSLPQNRYCADVAAEPAAGTTERALAAARGHLFAVGGQDQLSLLGEVYGSLEAVPQASTPATP